MKGSVWGGNGVQGEWGRVGGECVRQVVVVTREWGEFTGVTDLFNLVIYGFLIFLIYIK